MVTLYVLILLEFVVFFPFFSCLRRRLFGAREKTVVDAEYKPNNDNSCEVKRGN